jgi:hypothetical protein
LASTSELKAADIKKKYIRQGKVCIELLQRSEESEIKIKTISLPSLGYLEECFCFSFIRYLSNIVKILENGLLFDLNGIERIFIIL